MGMLKPKEELTGYYYPRFALFPKKINGRWIWFDRFYRKHTHDGYGGYTAHDIDSEEYCFLKLSGKLIPEVFRAYKSRSPGAE